MPGDSGCPSLPHLPLWVLQEPQGVGVHMVPQMPHTTPFYRTEGSRPLGAHCWHSIECVIRACSDWGPLLTSCITPCLALPASLGLFMSLTPTSPGTCSLYPDVPSHGALQVHQPHQLWEFLTLGFPQPYTIPRCPQSRDLLCTPFWYPLVPVTTT